MKRKAAQPLAQESVVAAGTTQLHLDAVEQRLEEVINCLCSTVEEVSKAPDEKALAAAEEQSTASLTKAVKSFGSAHEQLTQHLSSS